MKILLILVILSSCIPRDYPDCVLAFADQDCKFYNLKKVDNMANNEEKLWKEVEEAFENAETMSDALSESFEVACNNGLLDNCA